MAIDKYCVERNPINLLHPITVTEQNIIYAKNALREFDINNTMSLEQRSLAKSELEKIPEHAWLKECETVLVEKDDFSDESEILEQLYEELLASAETVSDEVRLKEPKKLIAVDLETTGLNKTIKRVGGKNIVHNHIVGICLSVDYYKGYYIPVLHNEKDGVLNFSLEAVINLLQKILDNFHCIYHNAVFDMEVLGQNGVFIYPSKQTFTDTMIMAILSGYREQYRQVGLKFLSSELLERPMLEITELMGDKKEVRLWTLPAKNAYVYGCSDAMNTLGLFHYITDERNPYLEQKNSTLLDHKTVHLVRNTYRHGLPINYKRTYESFRTMIRRIIILENTFYEICSNKEVSISSPEQVGTHIFNLLKKEFEAQMTETKRELNHKEKGFDILVKQVKHQFNMEVKVKELKSGEVRIVANSSDDVMSALYNNLEVWQWLSESVKDEIYCICEIIEYYRALSHEVAIFQKLLRYCYNDDLNICRGGISLKLLGADTSRFSNQSSRNGANDHLEIAWLTKSVKTTLVQGDGIIGINSQGISNKPGTRKKVKRVLNLKDLNEEVYNNKCKLDKVTDSYIKEIFEINSI